MFDLLFPGNGTLEFDEFVKMMTAKNKTGVTRWDRCKSGGETEPDSWRAFKVGFFKKNYLDFQKDRSSYVLHG